jgi:hypothetical protein
VHVNYPPPNFNAPFGGYKKSGNGRSGASTACANLWKSKASSDITDGGAAKCHRGGMKSDRATILGMFERPTTGGLLGETPPAPIDTFDPASLEIDDRAVRYIVQARETYADLRHCSAQLASLLPWPL